MNKEYKLTNERIISELKEDGYEVEVNGKVIIVEGIQIQRLPYWEDGKDYSEFHITGSENGSVRDFRSATSTTRTINKTVKTIKGIKSAIIGTY